MPARTQTLASSRLGRLARRPPASEAEVGAAREERCELCGEPIPAEHRHVLDVEAGELRCACRACSLLFDRAAAAEGRLRLVGDRRLRLLDFELTDLAWEQLRIPVEMAFFFFSSSEQRVMAFYPSPMGPTESLLGLEAWEELERANPVLREMKPDVEALLVNRAKGQRAYYLVPIDECYALVGLIRTRWKGLSGGTELWEEIGRFFDHLDRRSKARGESSGPQLTGGESTPETQANAATTAAAERR
jgi:hypothetical protein